MYILRQLGRLDDGRDRQLYYSPVKGTARPIWAICLAYHAVGNVVLACEDCMKVGTPFNEYFELNVRRLRPQLQTLEAALVASPGLTALGRALWEPLRDRLKGGALPRDSGAAEVPGAHRGKAAALEAGDSAAAGQDTA